MKRLLIFTSLLLQPVYSVSAELPTLVLNRLSLEYEDCVKNQYSDRFNKNECKNFRNGVLYARELETPVTCTQPNLLKNNFLNQVLIKEIPGKFGQILNSGKIDLLPAK